MAGRESGKPLVWLHGEVKTPPFSQTGRIEAGTLLRRLQSGEKLGLPHSRSMPVVGSRCHELRIQDQNMTWRIMYRIDSDAVIVAEVFAKKTAETPQQVIDVCQERLRSYVRAAKGLDK
jgi:phage-related protein